MSPPKTITIDVTREDIDKGVPKDSCRCAIARSLSRMFPGCGISVSTTILVEFDAKSIYDCAEYRMTKKVDDFIDTWDYADAEKRKKMKPRKFTVRLMNDSC